MLANRVLVNRNVGIYLFVKSSSSSPPSSPSLKKKLEKQTSLSVFLIRERRGRKGRGLKSSEIVSSYSMFVNVSNGETVFSETDFS